MVAAATSQEVAALYSSCKSSLGASKARIKLALKSFVDGNEQPGCSPNFGSPDEDPVGTFFDMLRQREVTTDAHWVLWLVKALKILSRKQDNRLRFGRDGLTALLAVLAPPLTTKIAAEGANVLLNACYEAENVRSLLDTTGVQQLVLFLLEDDEDLVANAAGAIQSICYQEDGRKFVCDKEGLQSLLTLLTSRNQKVVSRAVGAIHNLSSEPTAIHVIRQHGGIPTLVTLLDSEQLPVSGSAAGALQNISREVASRLIIRELDAVPGLSRLLSAPDVQAQVCASGALLNIVGPDLDMRPDGGAAQRRGLGRIMVLLMAAAAIYDCVYEQRPPLA